jgi:multidrug efflux pump subunit AcrA (membrane-fusion protein)
MPSPAPTRHVSGHAHEVVAELLPQQPPPWLAQAIGWLMIAIFTTAALIAALVPLPEVVRSPFVLISEQGADPVQSPILAVVQRVGIEEGAAVAAGHLLFALRSDEIRAWRTDLDNSRRDLEALRERIEKLEESFVKQVAIKGEETNQIAQELIFRRRHRATNEIFLERIRKVLKAGGAGIIADVQVMRYELNLAESEKEVAVTERKLEQARLDLQRMATERARERTDEQAGLSKLDVRIKALERQLENCTGDLKLVAAPYDAVVISLAQRTAGNVVQPGTQLCELSPVEGTPRARLLLKEEGLSRVATNQPVRFFFEAFPYQRYGSLTGTLTWVSPAAVSSPTGSRFVALATLSTNRFNRENWSRQVLVGMKGEARVHVGRRTLLQYALEPLSVLRQKFEQ